jgi:RsmE family RNA methyltransferase
MRAHFLESLIEKDDYVIPVDESLHHLLKVARLSTNEEVLLLNGRGLVVRTLVINISKKEVHLKTVAVFNHERKYRFDLALCMPKRDALDLCLKEATELGFEKIYLIKSDFSQIKFWHRTVKCALLSRIFVLNLGSNPLESLL